MLMAWVRILSTARRPPSGVMTMSDTGNEPVNEVSLDLLLERLSQQMDTYQREAMNASVANRTLEQQYLLGIKTGLNMAKEMLRSTRASQPPA